MFRWFRQKWHSVQWSCGDRHVGLSLRFDAAGAAGSAGGKPPSIRRLPAKAGDVGAGPESGAQRPDEGRIIADVLGAVEEFNQRNRTAIRVAAIRYLADDTTGHREATRKLLNRL